MPIETHNAKLIKLLPLLIISMPAKMRDGSRVHVEIKFFRADTASVWQKYEGAEKYHRIALTGARSRRWRFSSPIRRAKD